MVKIQKKEKTTLFKTTFGTNIKLDILATENILKIIVCNSYYSIGRRGVILVVLVILCILSLVLNILNKKLVVVIIILILLDLYRLNATVKEENLVTLRYLGFQLTTKYILGTKTIFIPREQVQKVFINEVIFRDKVIYVLCLLTKDTYKQEKLVPLFLGTLPRLACLKVIYKHIKEIIQD